MAARGRWRVDETTGEVVEVPPDPAEQKPVEPETETDRRRREARERGPYL